ncbi:hypothetical protein [Micromonospora sp. S-DT3-3-22]|uniref:hypothetical protein n=1 Tax=Micromonospora sp. S-DT3-3-22 TaxID=2755359 RepID=UPI00188EA80E|nr:hypothetical protein [Micromonospora sp. S-DT3-3-22]
MLNALTALELPHSAPVVPAIGLGPATMISYGKVNVPSDTATFGIAQADHIYVSPDEAIDYGSVIARPTDAAAELVARLIANHQTATGPSAQSRYRVDTGSSFEDHANARRRGASSCDTPANYGRPALDRRNPLKLRRGPMPGDCSGLPFGYSPGFTRPAGGT